MSVRVPFHLHRRPDPAPAAAVLLTSDDPAGLLAACARLADPLVFPVAGGFLVVAESIPAGVPNGVRLRRLSENGYLPVDADLVPALLPAEVVDLTARRGLVFLPNQAPLAFDATRPLKPAAFLAVPKPRRDDWERFPEGNPPADRLTGLTRVMPELGPDDVLADSGPPVGTGGARPDKVGPGRGALGRASLGLGKGLGALGRLFGSKKLKDAGAKLAGLGAALAPRLTEGLLGKQEAALQHLLKKFRQGNTDEALRHSVPIREPGRGSPLHADARLPTHNLKWSLSSLFGWSGGASSIWAGGSPDTWRELMAEYRKAAQEAADRGDFRRAAVIYARLLSDYRSAAEALARGGLHREAAILFRDMARQLDRAAQEFEKAGEHDEALRLYRDSHQYAEAGDLLRRLGEEERAIEEYHRAADRVIQLRGDHAEAGDILLKKTGRADLAVPYFERGWETRGQSLPGARNALPCAERLIEIYALGESGDAFWRVLAETEEWLREPGWAHDAGRFFNKVVECADLPHLRPDRTEIRDRCRLGLAGKLREHTQGEAFAGTAVADLFGQSKRWSPAVMSDADFALRAALKQRPPAGRAADRRMRVIGLHAGTVTAAVQAADGGDLFVGFQDGRVVHFDPGPGVVRTVYADRPGPIRALATDPVGELVAALQAPAAEQASPEPGNILELRSWKGSAYQFQSRLAGLTEENSVHDLLPAIVPGSRGPVIGWNSDQGIKWYSVRESSVGWTPASPLPATAHLHLRFPEPGGTDSRFTFQGGSVSWDGKRAQVGWMPDPVPGSTLFLPPVAWLVGSPTHVELAGLFDNATLYWTEVRRHWMAANQPAERLETQTLTHVAPGGFRAVCIWRPKRVVGVTATNWVVWLMPRSGRLAQWSVPVELPTPARAVACFPSRATYEVLVVLDDGSLVRVAVPG